MKNTNHSVLKHLHYWMIAVTALAAYNPKTNGSVINTPMANVPMTDTPTNNVQVSESMNSRLTNSIGTSPQPPHEDQADRPAVARHETTSDDRDDVEQPGQLSEDGGMLASPATKQRVPGTSTSQTTKQRKADRPVIASHETASEEPDSEQPGQLFEDGGMLASPTTKQRVPGTSTSQRNADHLVIVSTETAPEDPDDVEQPDQLFDDEAISAPRTAKQRVLSTSASQTTKERNADRQVIVSIETAPENPDAEQPDQLFDDEAISASPTTKQRVLGISISKTKKERNADQSISEEQLGTSTLALGHTQNPGIHISTSGDKERPCPNTSPGPTMWTSHGEGPPSLVIGTPGVEDQSGRGIRVQEMEGPPGLGTSTPEGEEQPGLSIWTLGGKNQPSLDIETTGGDYQSTLGIRTSTEANRGVWKKDDEVNPHPKIVASATEGQESLGTQTPREANRGVWINDSEDNPRPKTGAPAEEGEAGLGIQTTEGYQPDRGLRTPSRESQSGQGTWTPPRADQPSLEIQVTTEEDDGLWIMDDDGFPRQQGLGSQATDSVNEEDDGLWVMGNDGFPRQQGLGSQTTDSENEEDDGLWIMDDDGFPRQQGLGSQATDSENEEDDGLWIMDDDGFPRQQGLGSKAPDSENGDDDGLWIMDDDGFPRQQGLGSQAPDSKNEEDDGLWIMDDDGFPRQQGLGSQAPDSKNETYDGLWIIGDDGFPMQLGLGSQAPDSENDTGEEGSDTTDFLDTQPFEWIRFFFRDFNSQILALNLGMCDITCTFSFENLSGKYYTQHCAACSCDRHCHVYGDCCPDLQIPHIFTDVTDSSLKEGVRPPDGGGISTCQSTYIKVASTRDFRFMVNYCPSSFHPSNRTAAVTTEPPGLSSSVRGHLKAKCENWANSSDWRYQRPVHTSSGVVYRNKFCAQCHGERREDLTPWTVRVECADNLPDTMTSATELYDFAVNSPTCDIRFHKDGFPPRPCKPVSLPLISSCNQTGHWLAYDEQVERACASFYSVVIHKYKNLFCFLCNTNHTYISALMYLLFWSDKIANPARESFFALLDINDDDDDSSDESNMSDELMPCEKGTVRDPIQCECRAVQCGTGLVPQGNKCIERFAVTNSHGLNMCAHFHVHSDKPVNATFLEMLMEIMAVRLSVSTFRRKQQIAFTGVPRYGCDKTFLTLDVHVRTFNPMATRLENTARALRLYIQDVAKTLTTTTPHNVTATGPVQHCWQRSDLERIEDDCFPEGQGLPVMVQSPYDMPNVTYQPLYNTTLCAHVSLNESEFQAYRTHLQRLGLSEENVTQDVLTEKGETFYLLCVDDWLKIVTEDACTPAKVKVSSAGGFEDTWTHVGLTSIVCTCVSLMSLMCVMVTFTAVPPLRAGPGLSTLAMACLLFLAQALHEVGLEQYEVPQLCLVLALLIHFFWLAAVFMMTACTLQLYAAIVFPLKSRLLVQSSGRKLLAASLAFSLGCSAALVALTALGNHLVYDDLGYPADHVCFIKRSMSRYLGFGLPLGVAVVCNVVLFIIAVVHLRARPSISSTCEHRVSLVACFRLSTITGGCWLSLFLLPLPGTRPWLEYVAVVLLALQGLLLAATLLLNKRVWSLCTMESRLAHSQSTSDKYTERWAASSANTTSTSACS